jgi:hypothetical protein
MMQAAVAVSLVNIVLKKGVKISFNGSINISIFKV